MSDRDYMRVDYGDEGPRSPFWATYPATKAIMIGLGAIHLFMVLVGAASREAGLELYLALSLQPDAVLRKGYVWQLLTGPLLHGDLMHILWNVLGFWFFGRQVEQRLGVKRYLVFCAAAALTASLAFLAWAVFRSDIRAMVGASGAIAGIVILVACWYPDQTVLVFFVLPMRLWVMAVVWVLIDIVSAIQSTGDIANTAHLGGALYGFLYFRYGGGVERIFGAIDTYTEKRRREKARKQQRSESEMRAEIDRILDKVNREGMHALSEEEKRFLKKASGRLRR